MIGLAKEALCHLSDPSLLRFEAYVAGTWHKAKSLRSVIDPATGEEIAKVAECDATIVDIAVRAASAAFAAWSNLLAIERGSILSRWATLILENIEDLSVIMTVEQGKPLSEARGEIRYAASFLNWFAAEAQRTYGETIPSHKIDSLVSVSWQPIGVTAAITPWNFPTAMITRKAGAALAAGCPMIVKPAPETPLSALALAVLAERAGVPSGIFQVVTGDPVTLTQRLLAATDVRVISFTGSTEVGKLIYAGASQTIKRLSMELGGHAPFIAFADSPLQATIDGAISAKFATSGQDCLAANRIFIERPLYEDFVAGFTAAVKNLKIGHGLLPATDIGPMTRPSVAAKCRTHIQDALAKGARLMCGGIDLPNTDFGPQFIIPTVLADVTEHMAIMHEETFGPVAAVTVFDNEAELIARANATEMGLAAYLYTRDLGRASRVAKALEYGMVGVNTASFTGPPIPFGGWKQSGLGREGSRQGILEFMEQKYICISTAA